MSTVITAPTAPFFRQHAATLEANGYDPIPLPIGQKGPNLPAWQRYKLDPADASKHAIDGVGILTARTPAIDIDVRDATIAAELDTIVRAALRWPAGVPCKVSPIRIGLAPKLLRPCQLDGAAPFKKKQTAGYRLPGDVAGAKPHRVEILGDGQQFVAYNIHPDTGRPYTWTDGDPIQLLQGWLPLLSEADADALIKSCDLVLAKHGTPFGPASGSTRNVTSLAAAIRKAGDTWFEPLSDEQKIAEVNTIAATWTAEQATNRDSWFICIRSIADAVDRGLDRETGIEIAAEFSARSTGAVDTRDAVASKMFEGGSKSSIYAAAATARKFGYKPPPDRIPLPPPHMSSAAAAPDGEPIPQARHVATDQRNVGRIIAAYGTRLLSVGGKLYAWSGRHWEPDTGLARRFAGNLSRIVAEERAQVEAQFEALAKLPEANGEKLFMLKAVIDSLKRWGPKCEMAATQNAALKMLLEAVNINADRLDADPLLLNLENGTYNIRTGILQPYNPGDYITKIAPVKFDAAAICPRFDQFLIEVFDGNGDLIDFVLRWFGYCTSGETKEHYVVIHWGDGANGKGTLINTIAALLGDYASAGAPGLLTAKNGDQRHPAEIADLFGRRMATCSETDQGATLREGFIKQASGADKLKGRFLYGQFFEFFPTHKLQLMTNNKPVVRGTDHGIWRRLLLVPYLNIFGTAKDIADGKANKLMDSDLGASLRSEWPGILNRLLEGAREWLQIGLKPPPVILEASETYRRSQDLVGEYVREELTLNIDARTNSPDLYAHYAAWDAGATGAKPLASKAFLAELEKHVPGFKRKKLNGKRWIYGVTIGQPTTPAFGP